MNVKKISLLIFGIIVIGVVLYVREKTVVQSNGRITVGILQIASHPALDAARDGFIEELQSKMGTNVEFVVQNAQGSISNAHMIAQRFHKNASINAVYAIATPAAQAIATLEKETPIFIAAVTDRLVLGDQDNIYGVCDMIDMHKEIAMIQAFLPQIQTIAVIYSNAEANSIAQVQHIKQECAALNIAVLEVGISQESDLSSAVTMACRKADAVICPTDNMIALAMSLVVSIAATYKKPLFACHNQAVVQGALASRGVDYKECGKRVGQIACAVLLDGKTSVDLPVEQAVTNTIYVNKQTLQDLELQVPEALLSDVVFVETKE